MRDLMTWKLPASAATKHARSAVRKETSPKSLQIAYISSVHCYRAYEGRRFHDRAISSHR